MRLLKTTTIEEQIGELDAYMDDIVRKPRNSITKIITQIPGGILMEPVVSGLKIFAGFFTVAGSLNNLASILPMDAKVSTVSIESVCDNITTNISFQISKGVTSISTPVDIKANTKISISITSDIPISTATIGYVYTPSGV